MIRIKGVKPRTLAHRLGFEKGDEILSINDNKIKDILDIEVYRDAIEEWEIRDGRTGDIYIIEVKRPQKRGLELGFEFEEPRYTSCSNKCVFCFIDQNPMGLRKGLYFKDEDIRLSYLTGSYITLSSISGSAWKRIETQGTSPLYISIHSFDSDIRRSLGIIEREDILSKLRRLASIGICYHAQIVIVPDYNTGDDLKKSMEIALSLHPNLLSLSIVPVGLTKHRKGLPSLRPVSRKEAGEIIDIADIYGKKAKKTLGTRLIFSSDEMYLIAGRDIPKRVYYEDFPQIENGVGMIRQFMGDRAGYPKGKLPCYILTGIDFAPFLCEYLSSVNGVSVHPVVNKTFGDSVTVAGLLTGRDLLEYILNLKPDKPIFIPSESLNQDGLFLDGLSIDDIRKKTHQSVEAIDLKGLKRLIR